jgi:hypothetical protein
LKLVDYDKFVSAYCEFNGKYILYICAHLDNIEPEDRFDTVMKDLPFLHYLERHEQSQLSIDWCCYLEFDNRKDCNDIFMQIPDECYDGKYYACVYGPEGAIDENT